jgi:chromosome segregation ATPase
MKKYSEIIHKVQPQDISNVMEKGDGDNHDLGGVINTATTVGSLALVCMGPIGIGCAIGLYALSMGLSFGLQLWGSKKDDKTDKGDKDSKDDKSSSKKDDKKETTNKTGNEDLDQLLQDPPSLSEVASVMSAALATKDNKMSDEEREKLQKRVDKLNQACFDENGKERSPEDAQKWLDDNTTTEELAELTEYCDNVVKETNWKEVREQHNKNKKLTPSDLKDLLEARKKSAIQAYEATKNKEKAQKELENAQSEKDKADKELNQKNEEIANIEKEIKNLDKNSEGASETEKELNEKLEKAKEEQKELQKKKDEADEKWANANKKLKDLSNPEPKEEPKKGEDGDTKTEPKEEPKKGQDGDTKTEPK